LACWTLLRRPWPCHNGADHDERALLANGTLGSPARVFEAGGDLHCGAELPPLPGDPEAAMHLRETAERELDWLAGGGGDGVPAEPPELAPAAPELVGETLAAIREAGWPAEVKAGGAVSLPLGLRRRGAAAIALLGSHPVIFVEALAELPAEPGCALAVRRHAIALAGCLRLARPALATRAGHRVLIWAVPLAVRTPAFLDHALGAMAAFETLGCEETRALAAHPDLASRWLAIRAPEGANQQPTNH